MPDQATLNHAAQVLAAISTDQRADTALRFYFESHRYLQPIAKRAISHAVFVYFRWFSWLDPKDPPQKRVEQAAILHERFTADAKTIKAETLAVRAVPPWLAAEMDLPADYLRQLQRDPALWLRARPGKRAALAKSLFAAEPSDRAPDALRFTGTQDLFKTEQFSTGEFEIQDLASQLVGVACAPQPGETWWDACAGEGGKTLHLCDQMANKGVVWATDRNARRIDTLKRRAGRAKLFNYRTDFWDGGSRLPNKTKFDGILLDAPCSGVGTWQRNPHARWTTTPADVAELAATQLVLLNNLAGSLKPGGRLIYSVCTLTRSETTAVSDAFSATHPELELLPLTALNTPNATLMLWPHELNANGMFIAAWKRKK
ncbi:MAG: RsmB/NOP family class I SAM-dependent RNA methyltransferase [Opitutaceae bacterium]